MKATTTQPKSATKRIEKAFWNEEVNSLCEKCASYQNKDCFGQSSKAIILQCLQHKPLKK